jgi:hypothetical protein
VSSCIIDSLLAEVGCIKKPIPRAVRSLPLSKGLLTNITAYTVPYLTRNLLIVIILAACSRLSSPAWLLCMLLNSMQRNTDHYT